MEDIITLVVFLLFGLVGLLKHVVEKKRARPFDTGQPTVPAENLDEWAELERQPEPRRARAPAARPATAQPPPPVDVQKPVLTGRRVDPLIQEALRKLEAVEARKRAAEAQRAQPDPATTPPPLAAAAQQPADEVPTAGIPVLKGLYTRPAGLGSRRVVPIRIMGVKSLRQGIIIAEILGPPRAFDI
jgi:hypothetical protein